MKVKIEVMTRGKAAWNKHKSHINSKSLSNIARTTIEHTCGPKAFKEVVCAVLLSDDKEIKEYNKKFRRIDKATNVLSFPSEDSIKDNLASFQGKNVYLGDIAFSFDRIIHEVQPKHFDHYVYYLFIHGFLHLLGFLHDTDKNHRIMEETQQAILTKLDIPYKNF